MNSKDLVTLRVAEAEQDLETLEDRERKLLTKEAEFQQLMAEKTKALEEREAAAAADAKVHRCFYEELEEQKQLLEERDQAALEQAAMLEKKETDVEALQSKLTTQQLELQKLEQGLRKRELQCTQREQEAKQAASRARLEAQASREVEQTRAKMSTGGGSISEAGGVAGAIAVNILQDMEIGERSAVTLTDLGLSQISGLPEADRFLQVLSALMAVRADARLTVFGLWLLCHLIYVVYLIYAHLGFK
eukprot:Skav204594  [mRNA]  locus=scaffold672:185304:186115:- [translate_table: standard]